MPDSEQGHTQRPPLIRKRTGSKQVITSRHRNASSHTRLSKVARLAPMTSGDAHDATGPSNGKVVRSKSMDSLALNQLTKKMSPSTGGNMEASGTRRAGLTMSSRSQGRIAGPTPRMTGGLQKRKPAIISIVGDEEDSDEDSEEFEELEDAPNVKQEVEIRREADSVKHTESDPTLATTEYKQQLSHSDKPSLLPSASSKLPSTESEVKDPIQDSVPLEASTTSINALSNMLEGTRLVEKFKASPQPPRSDSDTDEDSPPSTPIWNTISEESLKPSRHFPESPAQPQISNETVLAVAPGSSASMGDSGASSPGFESGSSSTSVTKSHFLDYGTGKSASTSPVRSLRTGIASAPVLSRTQSSFGKLEDTSKRISPMNSASFTRTQQKLWLQKHSMDQQAIESPESMNYSERKKEDERITKEYQNVVRYANPLKDSIQRIYRARNRDTPINNPKRAAVRNAEQRKTVQNRVSEDRLGLSQSLPKTTTLSLSETTITVPDGLQGTSSKLADAKSDNPKRRASSSILESQITWTAQKDGGAFQLSNFPSALFRLWTITFEDPLEAAENARAEQAGVKKDGSPSILAQAQQAQQQMMMAQKLQAQKQQQQQQQQRQGQIGQLQRQPGGLSTQVHQLQQQQLQQQQQQQASTQQLPNTIAQGRAGNTTGTIKLG